MWQHVLLFVFLFAEEATTLSTYQPFLPSQRVDVQLFPDDGEPSKNEDLERALDSDPENLLAEAVRLLQIDNIQTLEKKLLLIESSLKEKEEEVQTVKVELENAQKAYGLALEEAPLDHSVQSMDYMPVVEEKLASPLRACMVPSLVLCTVVVEATLVEADSVQAD